MDQDMRQDVELLNFLCDQAVVYTDRLTGQTYQLSKKLVARWTNRAIQTISDYATGKINIPVEFWRMLLAHIDEPRIIFLLLGDRDDIDWAFLPAGDVRTTKDFLEGAIRDQGEYHQTQVYLAELLRDGRIDEADAPTVQKFVDAYVAHRATQASLQRSIVQAFNKAVAGRSS